MKYLAKSLTIKWKLRPIRVLLYSIIVIFVFTFSWHSLQKTYINEAYYNQRSTNRTLIDIRNFDYVINYNICSSSGDYLVILIHTAPGHFQHRNLIRSMWGKQNPNFSRIKLVFLLGETTSEIQQNIKKESELHKDLIQGNFKDSYRNLTYKHTMGLTWVAEYCPRAKYILKMDDDIFMDIYQFLHYVEFHLKANDLKNRIACYFQNGMPVVRDPVSKWYVSKEEYSSDTFDNYCSGWAYLTTPRVAHLLSRVANKMNYFWVDDVHLTGSVAARAKVDYLRINKLFALESDGLVEWSSNRDDVMWNKIFAPTWGDLNLSRIAHKKATRCYAIKCRCCFSHRTTTKPPIKSTTRKGIAKLIAI